MNEHDIEQVLKKMHTLTPRKESLGAIRGRVFAAIDSTPVASPIATKSIWFSAAAKRYASVALVLFAIVAANQIPMHSAYKRSVTSLAELQQSGERLEDSSNSVADAEAMLQSVKSTRAILDTLQLKGEFAKYSQEDCLHTYVIYDGFLDYVHEYAETQLPNLKDPAEIEAFKTLISYVEDSQKEAQARIDMYPSTKQ